MCACLDACVLCVCIYFNVKSVCQCNLYCIFIVINSTGADIEKGASTPLMEASQEGHIDIVKYLLDRGMHLTLYQSSK